MKVINHKKIEELRGLSLPGIDNFLEYQVELFNNAYNKNFSKMTQYTSNKTAAPEIVKNAHELKGACSVLGAENAFDICQKLELAGKMEDFQLIEVLLESLMEAVLEVKSELDSIITK